MGRSPCCDKQGLKKGPWTPEEDKILVDYIHSHGHGSWRSLPKLAGLMRCGKSCRLRWTNYLRPDIKRGPFTTDEQKSIVQLHGIVGNKWSTIAAQLPGRTDNEIKNYWNTHLKKQLMRMGLDPDTYAASASAAPSPAARHMAQWESARLEAEARLSRDSLLFSLASTSTSSTSASAPSPSPTVNAKPEEPDVFLRIWNSEVGHAFRKPVHESIPDTSSSNPSLSLAAPPITPAGNLPAEQAETSKNGCDMLPAAAESEASISDRHAEDDTSEDTYRLYLDFAGDEMGFFNGHVGLGGYSLFGEINDSSLDTAFK